MFMIDGDVYNFKNFGPRCPDSCRTKFGLDSEVFQQLNNNIPQGLYVSQEILS